MLIIMSSFALRIPNRSPPTPTLVSAIHDRMPVINEPENYARWLTTLEPDPRDLLVPYQAQPMTMWPISTRVNKPENDDASILDRLPPTD